MACSVAVYEVCIAFILDLSGHSDDFYYTMVYGKKSFLVYFNDILFQTNQNGYKSLRVYKTALL